MKKLMAMALIVAMPCIADGAALNRAESPTWSHYDTSGLKKYQATITRNDGRGNTKTFTDYCEARGVLEAQKIFEGRYPNDRVGDVREIR